MPTILRPQTAIIAIGKSHTIAQYIEELDDFKPAEVVDFSISADHRVLDGATVARFATKMKHYIENPNQMLMSMQ